MALNDIKVPKENAQGTFDEIALAASDLKLGTTANLPLKTGTNGVVEAGSFGTAAGSFCEGNDARLSDDRDPNLHAASHAAGGSDPIEADSLASTNTGSANALLIADGIGGTSWDTAANVFTAEVGPADIGAASASHTHAAADVTDLGTAATSDTGDFAASGSITSSGLTQSTARILGRTTASTGSIEEIQIGSGLSLSAGELSATSSGGISAVGASTADVLSVSGSDLVADDPNADRIVFWDDSEGKWRYLEAGSGLSISGTTMTATGGGNEPADNVFRVVGSSDSSKKIAFEADTNISAATTRTFMAPNRSGTMVVSDTSAGSGSDVVNNIVSLTQAEYNAIGSPDAATLFLITDP
jgi:hypothetical protein